jgi:hypothetical protein
MGSGIRRASRSDPRVFKHGEALRAAGYAEAKVELRAGLKILAV